MAVGYIKLFRQILDWGWYDSPNTFKLFIHLLLTVNFEEKDWHGIKIMPGQIATSVSKLSSETKLTTQAIRTALERLKSTKEITIITTKTYTLVSIVKWASYQQDQSQVTNESTMYSTVKQQTNNKPTTTTKEGNKERKEEKNIYGEFSRVKLTLDEYEKLVERFGKRGTETRIATLDNYLASKGDKYKSHYATILMWERKNELLPLNGLQQKKGSLLDDIPIE